LPLLLPLLFFLSFPRESASAFVLALAFLAVIPQGSASSFSFAVAFVLAVALAFLIVILSEAKNLLSPVLAFS
jgi:hypothetical protein